MEEGRSVSGLRECLAKEVPASGRLPEPSQGPYEFDFLAGIECLRDMVENSHITLLLSTIDSLSH